MNTRREFIEKMTLGAGSVALLSTSFNTHATSGSTVAQTGPIERMATKAKENLKELSKKKYPTIFDMPNASNGIGWIWGNILYETHAQTGTSPSELGVAFALRHDSIIWGMNSHIIKKFNLGEVMGVNNPITQSPAMSNPYYLPENGVFPMPGLAGIKGFKEKGASFYVCNTALYIYAGFAAQKLGMNHKDVYQEFIGGLLKEVDTTVPSGVWLMSLQQEYKLSSIVAG